MNGILFAALVLFCDHGGQQYKSARDQCVRAALDCVATAGAYDMTEKKATRALGDCLVPKVKP